MEASRNRDCAARNALAPRTECQWVTRFRLTNAMGDRGSEGFERDARFDHFFAFFRRSNGENRVRGFGGAELDLARVRGSIEY